MLISRLLVSILVSLAAVSEASAGPSDFARTVTERAFNTCSELGARYGKTELEADYFARRCLVKVLLGLETRVVSSKKAATWPDEQRAAHTDLIDELKAVLQAHNYESLNDYDRLNLYQAIFVAKKAQLELQ